MAATPKHENEKRSGAASKRGMMAAEAVRRWVQSLPGLRQQAKPENLVGLALSPQGIALAAVTRTPGARPHLTRCEYVPTGRQSDPGLILRNLTHQGGDHTTSFRLVLNPDEYQLHLVETPEVPAAELREAVRWRIRDLIDFPVDEAAIDVFDMPQQAASGQSATRMMNVVVARNPVIAQKAALVNRSGGELEVIDVPDLVLRNLLALTPADRAGAALLYVEPTFSLILITSDSTLYLSRRVFITQQDLTALSGLRENDEEFKRGAGAIAIELLRSMEYYETHFARPAVETLYIAPMGTVGTALQQHLERAFGVKVEDLDLSHLLDGAQGLSQDLQSRCLLAVGAALRQDRTTL